MNTDFVHLHNHTDYSLLDGAASCSALIQKAKSLGMKGLAITDHGNMFGALKFYKECKKNEINPIIGSEFYSVGPGDRRSQSGTETGNKYYHLILLAKNNEGYKNLLKLSALSYTEGFYYKPRIDDAAIIEHSKGLICSSACIAGEIPALILNGKLEEAEKKALFYRELFGKDSFFIELQNHGISDEIKANKVLIEIARKHNIPMIATNDLHYANKEDANVHDTLLCVGTNRKKNETQRMRFPGSEFYMKTAEEMSLLFPEVPECISNTMLINEMVKIDMVLPGPLLPDYEIPASFSSKDDPLVDAEVARISTIIDNYDDKMICKPHPKNGKVPLEEIAPGQRQTLKLRLESPITRYFIHFANDGIRKLYPAMPKAALDRLDFELAIIILMDFVGYFLIVADFINWAKDHDIPVGPGRGSGAGSIVAYAIRITDIDPLRYNLLFERFLNPERISMPDFDVDFCYEGRGDVINYVTQKYGTDRTGQIITFGTLKAKAVIKDVARALDISYDEANEIAKLIPDDPKMTLLKAFEEEPKLKEMSQNARYRELFETALKLENKNRHSSLHASGIVIGKTRLDDYVPLFKDAKTGIVATQFTMDQIEECGLVKMDFLGLKTLTLIKNTLALLKKRGINLESDDICETDKKTYDMLGEGKSMCVFQFESSGMQGILKQAKPNRMEDLIALNALYRPGPMAYIPQFIDCKWGRKAIDYPHPSLEPILKETYGVIVYQEQVMQVAQIIAGYSLGQADLLRRAMGKKKLEVLAKERIPFVEGALKNKISEADANRIFDILIPFAEYGFNKSHAAAYSVVAYRTAYLKANYPAEYMAANLTNEITNQDKLKEYIAETRKMGIEITAPDVNFSDRYFTVVEGKIVYGLMGIKNCGGAAVDEILKQRESGGPFANFMDFLDRVDLKTVNKKVLETMIQTGCFDKLKMNRATLLANLVTVTEYAQHKKDASKYGQASLFDACEEEEFPPFTFQEAEEFPNAELLRLEKELLGFYFSGHPMDAYKKVWERSSDLDISHPERSSPDRTYTIVGMMRNIREIMTKTNKRMAFGTLDDYSGSIDLVFFAKNLDMLRPMMISDKVVALRGMVDVSRSEPSFKVDEIIDPDTLKEKSIREVHIRLTELVKTEADLNDLRDYILEQSGSCHVYFHLQSKNKETIIKANAQIALSSSSVTMDRLRSFFGVKDVWSE